MVEAKLKELTFEDVDDGETKELESDVIFKPRTEFSSKALRKVVPQMNLKSQKVSLSVNL